MSTELEARVLGALEFIKRSKKDFFLREGEINTHIYFLLSGLVRIYHLTFDDKEVTSWLLKEGNIFISVYSFFQQEPSFENIVALEDCPTCIIFLRAMTVRWRSMILPPQRSFVWEAIRRDRRL